MKSLQEMSRRRRREKIFNFFIPAWWPYPLLKVSINTLKQRSYKICNNKHMQLRERKKMREYIFLFEHICRSPDSEINQYLKSEVLWKSLERRWLVPKQLTGIFFFLWSNEHNPFIRVLISTQQLRFEEISTRTTC